MVTIYITFDEIFTQWLCSPLRVSLGSVKIGKNNIPWTIDPTYNTTYSELDRRIQRGST